MILEVMNISGKKVSEIEDGDGIFEGICRQHLFYEVVKMQLAKRRSGSASTKTRGEIRGGGAKPFRQKGTGRARQGTTSSPILRHGGTVFGPHPRDYSYRMPKKAVRAALVAALRYKHQKGQVRILDDISINMPKTKELIRLLSDLGLESVLIVISGENSNLELAARNINYCKMLRAEAINLYDILHYENLLLTVSAFNIIKGSLAK